MERRIVRSVTKDYRDHVRAWLDGEPVAAELREAGLESSEARAVYELVRRDPEVILSTLEALREDGFCPFEFAKVLAKAHDRLWRVWGRR